MTQHIKHAKALLPTVEASVSVRKRLVMIATLVVGATLATAVGSTTLTELLTGIETPAEIKTPATQPTPATRSAAVVVAVAEPIKDVLPMLADRPAGDLLRAELILPDFGTDSGLIEGNSVVGKGGSAGIRVLAAGGSAAIDPVAGAVRAAAVAPLPRPQPVTFSGSPDLAVSWRGFRDQVADSYDYIPGQVVSDSVPALGMDTPEEAPAKGSAKPRKPRHAGSKPPLTWETVVNARPNGELAPPLGAIGDGTFDPWDGGGRDTQYDGWTPDNWQRPNAEAGDGTIVVPEPTTLLSLTLAAGLLGRRRKTK